MSGLSFALVAVGGAFGALARFAVDEAVAGRRSTFAVNVLGSTLLGAVAFGGIGDPAATLLGTGFCGAFTTYSSFAVEVASLAERGDWTTAARFGALNLACALSGVGVGAAFVSL